MTRSALLAVLLAIAGGAYVTDVAAEPVKIVAKAKKVEPAKEVKPFKKPTRKKHVKL